MWTSLRDVSFGPLTFCHYYSTHSFYIGQQFQKQSPLTYSWFSLCLFRTMEYISDQVKFPTLSLPPTTFNCVIFPFLSSPFDSLDWSLTPMRATASYILTAMEPYTCPKRDSNLDRQLTLCLNIVLLPSTARPPRPVLCCSLLSSFFSLL